MLRTCKENPPAFVVVPLHASLPASPVARVQKLRLLTPADLETRVLYMNY